MHQLEHGKNYLSVFSAINQVVVILTAVFEIKERGGEVQEVIFTEESN